MSWTNDEVEYLIKHYKVASKEDLENRLKRKMGTIRAKASSLGLKGRSVLSKHQWTDSDLAFVKTNSDKSYEYIAKELGRSVRAVQHKFTELNLHDVMWSDDEEKIVLENKHLSTKELMEFLPDRTQVAIEQKKRELVGSARKIPKFFKSEDVAWLFGMIYSDGYIDKYQLSFSQLDEELVYELSRVVKDVCGMNCRVSNVPTAKRFWSCSKEYNKLLGKQSWNPLSFIHSIEKNHSWFLEDPYVWHFLGGVFDGDGFIKSKHKHADFNTIGIAIKNEQDKLWFQNLLKSLGYSTNKEDFSITIAGGMKKSKDFLSKIQQRLTRKKTIQKKFPDGVSLIPMNVVENVMHAYHYLGTVPSGVRNYGYVENGNLLAIACFRKYSSEKKTAELKRFVLVKNEKNLASKALSAILKKIKQEKMYSKIITYADKEFHDGTIYLAANFIKTGETGSSVAFIAPDGSRFSGRYAIESAKNAGYNIEECKIKEEAGKIRFERILYVEKTVD